MPDLTSPQNQDPAEGSRKIIDRELDKIPDENDASRGQNSGVQSRSPRGHEDKT